MNELVETEFERLSRDLAGTTVDWLLGHKALLFDSIAYAIWLDDGVAVQLPTQLLNDRLGEVLAHPYDPVCEPHSESDEIWSGWSVMPVKAGQECKTAIRAAHEALAGPRSLRR